MHRKWLQDGLNKPGKTGVGLANYLDVDPSAVSRMLNGERQIKIFELPHIAEYLGVDLPHGVKSKKLPTTMTVTVVGIVSGGVWRDTGVSVMVEPSTIPVINQEGHKDQYALRIDGNSVNKVIPHNSYAICSPYWQSRSEITDGDLVHVERRSGGRVEATIKRVRRIGGVWELHPESDDPAHEEPIEYISSETESVEIIGLVVGTYKEIERL